MGGVGSLGRNDPLQVGPYEITGRLGRGGQGTVYLGRHADEPDGPQVAVKVLHEHFTDDPKARARLLREASVARRVARFCTAQVLDSGEDEDHRVYVVSEYVEGTPLTDLLTSEGPRTGVALERLAISTVTALAAIHEAGVVHLDFKPANILIGAEGPIVIDFGVSKALDVATSAVTTGQVVGSPAYMAPEQYGDGEVGPPADMFAWAITLVHAATGRPAFGLSSIPVMMQRILFAEPDLTGVEEPLRDLLTSCLAKDPDARPSAREALLHLIGQPAAMTRPDTPNPWSGVTTPPSTDPAAFDFSAPAEPAPAPAAEIAQRHPGQPPHAGLAVGDQGYAGPVRYSPYGGGPGVQPPAYGGATSDTVDHGVPPAPRKGDTIPGGPEDVSGGRRGLLVAGSVAGVVVVVLAAVLLVPRITDSTASASSAPEPSGGTVSGSAAGTAQPGKAGVGAGQGLPGKAGKSKSPGAGKTKGKGGKSGRPTPAGAGNSTAPPSTQPTGSGGGATTAPKPTATKNPYSLAQICGSGMTTIDHHVVGRATIYLMYNNSTGVNCVATTVSSSTGAVSMGAWLTKKGGSKKSDAGAYTFYAGPVRVTAAAVCVQWGGSYAGTSWTSGWSHCG